MAKGKIPLVELKPDERNILKEILGMEGFDNTLAKVLEHGNLDVTMDIRKELKESVDKGAISVGLNNIIKHYRAQLSDGIVKVKSLAEEKRFPIQALSMELLLNMLQDARVTLTPVEISKSERDTLQKNLERDKYIKEKKSINAFLSYLEKAFSDIYATESRFHISPEEEEKIFEYAKNHFRKDKGKQRFVSYLYNLAGRKTASPNQERIEWTYILNKLYEKVNRDKPYTIITKQEPLISETRPTNDFKSISFDEIHEHGKYEGILLKRQRAKNIIHISGGEHVLLCLGKLKGHTDQGVFVAIPSDECKGIDPGNTVKIKITKKTKNRKKRQVAKEYLLSGTIEA